MPSSDTLHGIRHQVHFVSISFQCFSVGRKYCSLFECSGHRRCNLPDIRSFIIHLDETQVMSHTYECQAISYAERRYQQKACITL